MTEPRWCIDSFALFHGRLHIAGWAIHPQRSVREITAAWSHPFSNFQARPGLASPDVAQVYGPDAANSRFTVALDVTNLPALDSFKLVFALSDGTTLEIGDIAAGALAGDRYHALQVRFFEMMRQRERGTVLEIGSRNRSGIVRTHLLSPHMQYVGMDIKRGDNVDVIGDAHVLGELFEPGRFDGVFSVSVFEHLLMPWKVAIEMNRVMKVGGLVMCATHQAFPLHEEPWDFWRFSDRAWRGIFNQATGFRIIDTALGERASVVAHFNHNATHGIEDGPAFLGSAVLCEKIGETSLRWDVSLESLVDNMYPV
jgi:hypothetical protein